MRRGVLVLVAVVVAVLAAVADAGSRPVSVRPGTGRSKTTFVVRFRTLDRAGRLGTIWRQYDVDASGPAGRRGCVSQMSVPVRQADARAGVRADLDPAGGANVAGTGRWCTGTFHGVIEETQTPVCSAGTLCPLFVLLVKRIGKFTFRVR